MKQIKQHLRIKGLFGTRENAARIQIWIDAATCVLIAIIKKRAALPRSVCRILQVLSVTMFETTPIDQLLAGRFTPAEADSAQLQRAFL